MEINWVLEIGFSKYFFSGPWIVLGETRTDSSDEAKLKLYHIVNFVSKFFEDLRRLSAVGLDTKILDLRNSACRNSLIKKLRISSN